MKERRKAHIEDNVESFPLEKRYLHKDGHVVWVGGTASMVRNTNGQPAYVLGQLQDITETKKLEEEARAERENFRLAMESIADGVVLFDNDDKFVFCNSAYRKNLGPVQDLLVPGTTFETIVRAVAEKGLVTIPKGDLEGVRPPADRPPPGGIGTGRRRFVEPMAGERSIKDRSPNRKSGSPASTTRTDTAISFVLSMARPVEWWPPIYE
ncbi:MAG: PAS domain S-box protein [Proteobacteria bacterium]|nr:PAS domain S-box protein [Pseudomonadota bacterium]